MTMGRSQQWIVDYLKDPPDTTACIHWPFSVNTHGYPQVRWDKRQQMVSRILLTKLIGPPPSDAFAAHLPEICHDRGCLNWRHLRWATPKENTADRELDGTVIRGEDHPNTDLTEQEVFAIYNADGTRHEIATQHDVTEITVKNIRTGRTWSWLTGHKGAA